MKTEVKDRKVKCTCVCTEGHTAGDEEGEGKQIKGKEQEEKKEEIN